MSAKTFPELIIEKNKEIERLTTEVNFHKRWIDSLLADSGPVHKAHSELSRYFLHAGIDFDLAMNDARVFLESAIDGTYDGFPEKESVSDPTG